MKFRVYYCLTVLFLLPELAGADLTVGKYAGDFLAVGVGARPLALGGAFTSVVNDISAIYWNPAGLAQLSHAQMQVMHSERFAGIVNWDYIGAGIPLKGGSAVALGIFRLGVDGIPLTRLKDPTRDIGEVYFDESGQRLQNVPYAYKYVNPSDLAIFGSYGVKWRDRLWIGVNAKLIRRSAEVSEAWGIGFDAGLLAQIKNNLRFGAMLRDATTTLLAWSGGHQELIVPRFQTGVSYPIAFHAFSFLPVFDLITYLDNTVQTTVKMGRMGMDILGGLEVTYQDRIALRVGSNAGTFTAGAGFRIAFFSVDYGFQTHSELGMTHRISLTLTDIRDKFSQIL